MVESVERIDARLKNDAVAEREILQYREVKVVVGIRAEQVCREGAVVVGVGLVGCNPVEDRGIERRALGLMRVVIEVVPIAVIDDVVPGDGLSRECLVDAGELPAADDFVGQP